MADEKQLETLKEYDYERVYNAIANRGRTTDRVTDLLYEIAKLLIEVKWELKERKGSNE